MNRDIAIIGMAGQFPGAKNIEELNKVLREGIDCITPIQKDRIKATSLSQNGNYRNNGYLEDVDKFDYDFFNISKAEAETMEPNQRLLLKITYQIVENAGYNIDVIKGANASVYVNEATNDYFKLAPEITPTLITGNAKEFLAARISRYLDIKGTTAMINTSCSSSLAAIHFACNELILGHVDFSFVLGINVDLYPHSNNSMTLGLLSSDGKSKAFSDKADGMSRGELAAGVMLKPLDRALKDKDIIHAVIRGTAINNNGAGSSSLTAPNSNAIANVLKTAWRRANINPLDIEFIEAHGAGTELGDSLEFDGMNQAFSEFTDKKQFCAISTIKSNIGHGVFASGMSGFIKAVLALKNKTIYPLINFERPNDLIDLDNSAVYISKTAKQWHKNDSKPRIAGVTSIGFSGTNCHIILQESSSEETSSNQNRKFKNLIFPISSKTIDGLKSNLQSFKNYLLKNPDIALEDVSYTLLFGRKHFNERCLIIAHDKAELLIKIDDELKKDTFTKNIEKTVFIFSDQEDIGKEYIESLVKSFPALIQIFDACKSALDLQQKNSRIFTYQYCLLKLLKLYGISTQNFLPIGIGKIIAEYSAGSYPLDIASKKLTEHPAVKIENIDERVDRLTLSGSNNKKVFYVDISYKGILHNKLLNHPLLNNKFEYISVSDADISESIFTILQNYYLSNQEILFGNLNNELPGEKIELFNYNFDEKRCWIRDTEFADTINIPNVSSKEIKLQETKARPNTILELIKNRIIDSWRDVLKVEVIDENSDFFELGGDSLKATKVINQLSGLNANLDFEDIFDFPKINSLSEFIRNGLSTIDIISIIWIEVLKLERKLNENDDFFELGGHSLLANAVLNQIKKEFKIDLNFEDFFKHPSLIELTNLVAKKKEESNLKINVQSLIKVETKEYYPLSAAQKRIYLLQEMDLKDSSYNEIELFRTRGKLDLHKLERAFIKIIQRHQILRTTFDTFRDSVFQIIKSGYNFKIQREQIKNESIDDFINRNNVAFSLKELPLFKVIFVEDGTDTGYLLMIIHHIITDGSNAMAFVRDLISFYNETDDNDPVFFQYIDFVQWHNQLLNSPKLSKQKEYWLHKFQDEPSRIVLPYDFPYPTKLEHAGSTVKFTINSELTHGLKELAKKEKTSLFTVLVSIFNILLSKLSNMEDIIIGTPVANREHADLEEMMGIFINILLLRNNINSKLTFLEFLREVKSNVFEAFSNQDFPYEELVEKLLDSRDTNRNALFDVMFSLQNMKKVNLELPNCELKPYDFNRNNSKLDLVLVAEERDQEIDFKFEYRTSLFKKDTIDRFIIYFKQIVSTIIQSPTCIISAINIVSASESQKVLFQFNSTEKIEIGNKTIIDLFEQQALSNPHNIAISCGDKKISYEQLNNQATIIAGKIRNKMSDKNPVVGLMLSSSIEMIAGMLGVMKCGGAFVPMSGETPVERNKYILSDCNATLLLVNHDIINKKCVTSDLIEKNKVVVIGGEKNSGNALKNTDRSISLDDPIYIIYTSGTSGTPKGVVVNHKGVVNYSKWRIAHYGFSPNDVTLQLFSYHFDGFGCNAYPALLSGGTLILIPDEKKLDTKFIINEIKTKQVTNSLMTPGIYEVLLNELTNVSEFASIRFISLGGDKTNKSLLRTSKTKLPNLLLTNEYGPTEASIASTFNKNFIESGSAIIGKPISNTSIFILGKNNELQPVGTAGELCISGVGIARGYVNNVSLTNDTFVKNPFTNGEIMYKTGDLVRWLPDGNIEFLGRIDNQVKIRGYRIELGEIENQLLSHKQVTEALVLDKDKDGNKYLTAYFVSKTALEASELAAFLKNSLPDYMIPSYFIQLEKMPLTINGKIDKRALPIPEIKIDNQYVEPSGEIEQKLVEIWSEVLKIDKQLIGIKNNFFELGGNSLRATVMINKIFKELSIDLPVSEVFLRQNIQELAKYITHSEKEKFVSIKKVEKKEYYDLSSAQKRLFILQQLDVESTAYNMPTVIQLGKDLKAEKIERTFKKIIERHESLRTFFEIIDEKPVQRISSKIVLDVEHYNSKNTEFRDIQKSFIRPFDLGKAPLFRIAFIEMHNQGLYMLFDMHHIITDGISQEILIKEFSQLYNNEPLAPVNLQFKDFVYWHLNSRSKVQLQQEQFWVNEFSDSLPVLDLPTDFIRPKNLNFEGQRLNFTLSSQVTHGIKELTRKSESTLFITLLSMWTILLSKLSGLEDIIVGTSISGRQHSDLENIMGMFINTLCLRNYPTGEKSVNEFLKEVKERTLKAFENQDYQFEDLVEKLNVARDINRNPIFNVLFVLQNQDQSAGKLKDYQELHEGVNTSSKFDITLLAFEAEDRISFNVEYSTSLFKKSTVEQFTKYFTNIIGSFIADPEQKIADIQILDKNDRDILLKKFNATEKEFNENLTIPDLFINQCKRNPHRIAGSDGVNQVTYEQINIDSDKIANYLYSLGIGNGNFVGVYMDRDVLLLPALMGILKTGASYLPLDTSLPVQRIEYLLNEVNAKCVISRTNQLENCLQLLKQVKNLESILCMDNLPDDTHFSGQVVKFSDLKQAVYDTRKNLNFTSDNIAYVIYTSGSTGKPKGVIVRHKPVINLIEWVTNTFNVNETDKIFCVSSISFDLSVYDIFGVLATGGNVRIAKKTDLQQPQKLIDILIRENITFWDSAPARLSSLEPFFENIRLKETLNPLRLVFLSGDWIPLSLPEKLKKSFQGVEVIGLGGATEATVWSNYFFIKDINPAWVSIPYGKPMHNAQYYILDKYLNPCPVNCAGDLYIGGLCLADGYFNDEALTASKFINNPFGASGKLFKTGDRAKWFSDGNIEFLGRIDNQVKIRGYRIELGEIESNIVSYNDIEKALVITKEKQSEKYLVAYYISKNEIQTAGLRKYLLERLPEYMVPLYFVHLDQFPITSNGKLDRKALPEPDIKIEENYVAPVNAEERILVEVWSKVLNIPQLGVNNNFFAIGGDSIKSIQISTRVRNQGYQLTIQDLFKYQTIRELAPFMKKIGETSNQSLVTGEVPLTSIQQWFFQKFTPEKAHFNQSVLLHFSGNITEDTLREIIFKLQEHHDALRMVFKNENDKIVQYNNDNNYPVSIDIFDYQTKSLSKDQFIAECNKIQSSININNGPLMKIGLFLLKEETKILIVIHHLVIDGLSWRILIEDFDSLLQQKMMGSDFNLPSKTNSYQIWATKLNAYKNSIGHSLSKKYWEKLKKERVGILQRDNNEGRNLIRDCKNKSIGLTEKQTIDLSTKAYNAFGAQINDILLTAITVAYKKSFGANRVLIDLEGHGRQDIMNDVNISRTIGWFTCIYPVLLGCNDVSIERNIKEIKETLRKVPNNGIDYLLYKYSDSHVNEKDWGLNAQISFNYLGQTDADVQGKSFKISLDDCGNNHSLDIVRDYDWEITSIVSGGKLGVTLTYSKNQYKDETINLFLQQLQDCLLEIINCCSRLNSRILTPSDLTYTELTIDQLDELQNTYQLEDVYPLTPLQEGILFHYLYDLSSANYFEQISYRMRGELNLELLQTSLNKLISRHAILGSLFLHKGYKSPIQLILKERDLDFNFIDVQQECQFALPNDVIDKYRKKDIARKFILESDVLIRVTVLQLEKEEFAFIWSHHHIIMDGWSLGIIISEFITIYLKSLSGQIVSLPSVQPYSRYIAWLKNRDEEKSANFWKNYLEGYDSLASLLKKEVLPLDTTPYALELENLVLNREQTSSLHRVCMKYGVTINTIFQSAWGLLLSKYNNTNDVVFGSVVSGRPAEIQDIETIVGMFINTIPVRIQSKEGETIDELLNDIQKNALQSEQYHYNSLPEIQTLSGAGRGLLDHIMVFENFLTATEIGEVMSGKNDKKRYTVTDVQMFEQTNYDLSIYIIPGEEINIRFSFNSNVYDRIIIKRALSHLTAIIKQISSDGKDKISDIDLLSKEEKHQLLNEFNNTKLEYPKESTIISLFEQQVIDRKGAIALEFGDEKISYQDLNDRSNQLARTISKLDVGNEKVIGILMPRSVEMIVSIIGILKMGYAYVPIDPDYPVERIKYIINDSGLSLLLTNQELQQTVESYDIHVKTINITSDKLLSESKRNLKLKYPSSSLAYMIYTSGSTGNPKGVMIEHRNVVNFVWGITDKIKMTAGQKILCLTTISFDIFVLETILPLLKGLKIVLADSSQQKDYKALEKLIKDKEVDLIQITPSHLKSLISAEQIRDILNGIEVLMVGGEAMPAELLDELRVIYTGKIYNMYGPTETTVWSTVQDLTFAKTINIGKPIANTIIQILDTNNRLQPIGIPGELCIGGDGVGRGYWKRQELSREKFISDPVSNSGVIYRTGDLARWLPDGNIEFLGRIDNQVKIRGFRIELGEIEVQLAKHNLIKESVAVAKEKDGNKYLVAYYISNKEIDTSELRSHLSEKLPDYMIPSYFVHLESLPLTSNGKINRKALPNPEIKAKASYIAPSNETEKQLIEIWSDILNIQKEEISVDASFFDLGGHSLRAISLVNKIEKDFNIKVVLKDIYSLHNIENISDFIITSKQLNSTTTLSLNESEIMEVRL